MNNILNQQLSILFDELSSVTKDLTIEFTTRRNNSFWLDFLKSVKDFNMISLYSKFFTPTIIKNFFWTTNDHYLDFNFMFELYDKSTYLKCKLSFLNQLKLYLNDTCKNNSKLIVLNSIVQNIINIFLYKDAITIYEKPKKTSSFHHNGENLSLHQSLNIVLDLLEDPNQVKLLILEEHLIELSEKVFIHSPPSADKFNGEISCLIAELKNSRNEVLT